MISTAFFVRGCAFGLPRVGSQVVSQLLPLVLPTVDNIDPAEITWALTVAQTRSHIFALVPLIDMLNHHDAPTRVCNAVPPPQYLGHGYLFRAMRALHADPSQLRVETGPDGAALLMRGGRPLYRRRLLPRHGARGRPAGQRGGPA